MDNNKSVEKAGARKRTRSVKGQAFDEMQANNRSRFNRSKSESQRRKMARMPVENRTKSKVSRRIVFNDKDVDEQVNNNSSISRNEHAVQMHENPLKTAIKNKKAKLLHSHFKNVWKSGMEKGAKLKKLAKTKTAKKTKVYAKGNNSNRNTNVALSLQTKNVEPIEMLMQL